MEITLEELRAKAKEFGYRLVKIQPKERFLPCSCGCNRRTQWTGNNDRNVIFICDRCGKQAYGKNRREAVHNWNEMIKKEENGDERIY